MKWDEILWQSTFKIYRVILHFYSSYKKYLHEQNIFHIDQIMSSQKMKIIPSGTYIEIYIFLSAFYLEHFEIVQYLLQASGISVKQVLSEHPTHKEYISKC